MVSFSHCFVLEILPKDCQIELIWLFTVASKIVGKRLQKRKSKKIVEREKTGTFDLLFELLSGI